MRVLRSNTWCSGLDYSILEPIFELAVHQYPDKIVMIDTPASICAERRKKRNIAESYEEAKGDYFLDEVSKKMKFILESDIFVKIPYIR